MELLFSFHPSTLYKGILELLEQDKNNNIINCEIKGNNWCNENNWISGSSVYFWIETEEQDYELRISDHSQPAFGGYSNKLGYRHGKSDISFVGNQEYNTEDEYFLEILGEIDFDIFEHENKIREQEKIDNEIKQNEQEQEKLEESFYEWQNSCLSIVEQKDEFSQSIKELCLDYLDYDEYNYFLTSKIEKSDEWKNLLNAFDSENLKEIEVAFEKLAKTI